MVQRYSIDFEGDPMECDCGDFVYYEDFEAVEKKAIDLAQTILASVPVSNTAYWRAKEVQEFMVDMARDRKEQDELLDEWYRTEECPYDKR